MEQILILNNGTRIFPARATLAGGILWIYIDNTEITLAEAFELLADPGKTNRIVTNEFGVINEYEGFTDLFCIRKEDNGQVNAGLKKAVE